jgi:hypothetical protein
MSAGTRIVALRMPDETRRAVLGAVDRANLSRMAEPYSFSSWVLTAVDQRLKKLVRGNKPGRRRKPRKRRADRGAPTTTA